MRPLPLEFWRWELAREFGWTLEYIDGLSLQDMVEYWQIVDGRNKANAENNKVKVKWRKR